MQRSGQEDGGLQRQPKLVTEREVFSQARAYNFSTRWTRFGPHLPFASIPSVEQRLGLTQARAIRFFGWSQQFTCPKALLSSAHGTIRHCCNSHQSVICQTHCAAVSPSEHWISASFLIGFASWHSAGGLVKGKVTKGNGQVTSPHLSCHSNAERAKVSFNREWHTCPLAWGILNWL